jgi:hypothetical protein
MSLKSKIKDHKNIAVFTRNHRKYIEEAVARNLVRPERFTTFRSAVKWTNAHFANSEYGAMPIYFAPIGSKKRVEYEALLHQIHLDPVVGQPDTIEILALELESTKNEGLWEQYEKPVKTLYVISHCKRLEEPFPFTSLIKLEDEKPISENYGYSYSIVFKKDSVMKSSFEFYPDEISEPAKYIEGATKTVSVNVYERSTAARKACIDYYGVNCSVCNMNFHREYGEIGSGFIHVHHLKSLAKLDEQYEVDPINDLRPVCPNCHAMLHKETPSISIDLLKLYFNKKENSEQSHAH